MSVGKCGRFVWLLASVLALALVTSYSSVSADEYTDQLTFVADSTPVALEGVMLSSSAQVAGSSTQLQVRFTTPDLEFPFDYRVGVTFPEAFGFDSSVSAVFSDDSPAPDPEIQLVEIVDHTVIFTFRRTFFAPKQGQVGIIDVQGVTLPTGSGGYAATVFMSDINFVVLAGPTFTSEIDVAPDVASSIALSPIGEIIVTAGELLTFIGNSVDQFGNPVSDSTLTWSFTADSDSLGVITPGNLLATKTGSGRIVVSSALAADTSGTITVTAGELARLRIEMNREQFVGGGICGPGIVRAFDQFDNPKSNFAGVDTLLQLSVSDGAITPEVFPVSAFDSSGVLDLASAGVSVNGFHGALDLTARIGSIVSPIEVLSITGLLVRPIGGVNQPSILPTSKEISTSFRVFVQGTSSVRIDSVIVVLPNGQISIFDEIFSSQKITVTDFLSPAIPTASEEDTLTITSYGTPLIVQAPGEKKCSIISNFTVPLKFDSEHISQSESVDTILSRSKYSHYTGFGLASPFSAQILRNQLLSIPDNNGELFQFAGSSFGPGFSLNGIFHPLLNIEAIPSSFESGSYPVTMVAFLDDGFFSYSDTITADSQLYLINAARFDASASDLLPATNGSPGELVRFRLPVSILGAFDDSASFSPKLQLYRMDTTITIAMSVSAARDTLTAVDPIRLPTEFAATSWGVRLLTRVLEDSSKRDDTLDLGPDVYQIGPPTQITIASLTSDAPNVPFLSSGQQVNLLVQLVNGAAFEVTGVQVSADTTVVFVGTVGAGDTVEAVIPYVAGDPTSLQAVEVMVSSANGNREESQAQIQFTVQARALLNLRGTLNTASAADALYLLEIGSPLALQLRIDNDGEAAISEGTALVTASGAGLDFSAIVELNSPIAPVAIGVPSVSGRITLIATVLDSPQELNTAADASFTLPNFPVHDGTTFRWLVDVVDQELLVNAKVILSDTSAIAFGERREMFSLELGNSSPLDDADVEFLSLVTFLRDANGKNIDPSEVIDISRSALFDREGKAVAILRVENEALIMDMTPNVMKVSDVNTFSFVAQFQSKSAVRTFSLDVPVEEIKLKVIAGQRNGALLSAQAPAGAPPLQSVEYTLTAAAFVESFQPQNNPFDPSSGATQYSYTLSEDSDIELTIYTLTGKLVRRFEYSAGSQYAVAGVQTPSWDGRNGNGSFVRDGVYVVALTNLNTGEKAYIKQAVMR